MYQLFLPPHFFGIIIYLRLCNLFHKNKLSIWESSTCTNYFCHLTFLALNLRKSFISMEADIVQLTKGTRIRVCFDPKSAFFYLFVSKAWPTNKEYNTFVCIFHVNVHWLTEYVMSIHLNYWGNYTWLCYYLCSKIKILIVQRIMGKL
jgi:hypothetical protein